MVSLNKVAFDVLNSLRGGHSENTRLPSIRQIKQWVLNYRAMLIRQAIQAGDMPTHFEQTMDNIPFVEVEFNDGGRFGADDLALKSLLRSQIQIPDPVRTKQGLPAFTYIGEPHLINNYELVDYHEAFYKNKYSRYTGNEPRATWFQNQIWITNFPPAELPRDMGDQAELVFTVRGIFEDPGAAFLATGWNYTDDSDYFPMPADIAKKVVQSILGGPEVRMMIQMPNDVILNTRPDGLTSIDNG